MSRYPYRPFQRGGVQLERFFPILLILVWIVGSQAQPCTSSPCRNGGTCQDFGSVFACTCFAGYSGSTCQTVDWNGCTLPELIVGVQDSTIYRVDPVTDRASPWIYQPSTVSCRNLAYCNNLIYAQCVDSTVPANLFVYSPVDGSLISRVNVNVPSKCPMGITILNGLACPVGDPPGNNLTVVFTTNTAGLACIATMDPNTFGTTFLSNISGTLMTDGAISPGLSYAYDNNSRLYTASNLNLRLYVFDNITSGLTTTVGTSVFVPPCPLAVLNRMNLAYDTSVHAMKIWLQCAGTAAGSNRYVSLISTTNAQLFGTPQNVTVVPFTSVVMFAGLILPQNRTLDNCGSNGVCNNDPTTGNFTCVCRNGYSGSRCQTETNECASLPCRNGGTCNDGLFGYNCTCPAGFLGTLCQTNINECASIPCQNGGTCSDAAAGFSCICASGFSGGLCQTNVNECASVPCQNGGTCSDLVAGFTCACPIGFSGALCQTQVNECGSMPCRNGGTCTDGIDSYLCTCPDGFLGTFCETNVNECISAPCLNSATCVDGSGSFSCLCVPGYSGALCQTEITECASQPCRNSGTCMEGLNGYTCICTSGFSGLQCQTNINECGSRPCQNGATCVDSTNGYTCTCPQGYIGVLCSVLKFDSCLQNSFLADSASGIIGVGGTANDLYRLHVPSNTVVFFKSITPLVIPQYVFGLSYSPQQHTSTLFWWGYDTNFCSPSTNGCYMELNPATGNIIAVRTLLLSVATGSGSLYESQCGTGLVVVRAMTSRPTNGQLYGIMGSTLCLVEIYPFGTNQFNITILGTTGFAIGSSDSRPYLMFSTNGTTLYGTDARLPGASPTQLYSVDFAATGVATPIATITSTICDTNINTMSMWTDATLSGNQARVFMQCGFFTRVLNVLDLATGVSSNTQILTLPLSGQHTVVGYTPPINLTRIRCSDHGVCTDNPLENDNFTCTCDLGFTGSVCQTDVNECGSFPCQNGATCVDGTTTFTCLCPPGFSGVLCQTDINECVSNPCQNGGVCLDLVNAWSCLCPPGFRNTTCNETSFNPCIIPTMIVNPTSGQAMIDRVHPQTNQAFLLSDLSAANRQLLEIKYCKNTDKMWAVASITGVTPNRNVAQLDPYTGALLATYVLALPIGCSSNALQSLACDPTPGSDLMYALMGSSGTVCLLRINQTFFNASLASTISGGLPASTLVSIDFDNFANLYAWRTTGSNLYTINVNTGVSALVGSASNVATIGCPGNAIVFSDIAFDTDNTQMKVWVQCSVNQAANRYLVSLNLVGPSFITGTSTRITVVPSSTITWRGLVVATNATSRCHYHGQCLSNNTLAEGAFVCACDPGYSGSTCQTDINECASLPCMNNGVCVDGVNSFTCQCPPGYAGALCQTVINACASFPCLQGGTCLPEFDNQTFTCQCPSGVSGFYCQTNVNECASIPCLNGGTCVDALNGFSCICASGFSGILCQTNVNECSSIPCRNGGTCADQTAGYSCTCAMGFSGLQCQTNINECVSAPCINGGTCVDGTNSFSCSCIPGYGGTMCQLFVSPCGPVESQHFRAQLTNYSTISAVQMTDHWVMMVERARGDAAIVPAAVRVMRYFNGSTGGFLENWQLQAIQIIADQPANLGSIGDLGYLVGPDGEVEDRLEYYQVNASGLFSFNEVVMLGASAGGSLTLFSFNKLAVIPTNSDFFAVRVFQLVPVNFLAQIRLFRRIPTSVYTSTWTNFQNLTQSEIASPDTDPQTPGDIAFTPSHCGFQMFGFAKSVVILPGTTRRYRIMTFLWNPTLSRFAIHSNFTVPNLLTPSFSYSIDLSCNHLVLTSDIAAYTNPDTGVTATNAGRILVYPLSATTPLTEDSVYQELNRTGAINNEFCGNPVLIEDETLVTACPSYNQFSGYNLGRVLRYTLQTNGETWSNFPVVYNDFCSPDIPPPPVITTSLYGTFLGSHNNIILSTASASVLSNLPDLRSHYFLYLPPCLNANCTGVNATCQNILEQSDCSDCSNNSTYLCDSLDCASNPCQNGGTCGEGLNSFTCICAAGFSGQLCQTNVNECASVPCQNSGTCVDLFSGFSCTCVPGYSGTLCQTEIDECASRPCQNDGFCIDAINGFSCICMAGFSGVLCQTNINECASQPCFDGSTCLDGTASYTCLCPDNLGGPNCQDSPFCGPIDFQAVKPTTGYSMIGSYPISLTTHHLFSASYNPSLNIRYQVDTYIYGGTLGLFPPGVRMELPPSFVGQDFIQMAATDDLVVLLGHTQADDTVTELEIYNFTHIQTIVAIPGLFDFISFSMVSPPLAVTAMNDLFFVIAGSDPNNGNSIIVIVYNRTSTDDFLHFHSIIPVGGSSIVSLDLSESDCPLPYLVTTNMFGNTRVWTLVGNTWTPFQSWTPSITTMGPVEAGCFQIIRGYPQATATRVEDGISQTGAGLVTVTTLLSDQSAFNISEQVLTSPRAFRNEGCGLSIDLHNQTLMVGCRQYAAFNVPPYDVGRAIRWFPFMMSGNPNGTVWGTPQVFNDYCNSQFAPGVGSLYGSSVASFNGIIAVGAPTGLDPIYIYQDPCLNDTFCLNNGTCASDPIQFNFTCTCPTGFTGDTCEMAITVCLSQPCQNAGSCLVDGQSFTCLCLPGFSGFYCETNVDECASQPCRNGGTCVDHAGSFSCTCLAGYSGTLCETDVDECASIPCQNGGTCGDRLNGYNCTCPCRYTGVVCQTDTLCTSFPCQNAGTCALTGNDTVCGFNCTCSDGFIGTLCETNVDECASIPCRNGGTCLDGIASYICACPPGFLGTVCETNIDECASVPCQNGGTCLDHVNGFNCTCPCRYTGTFCQSDSLCGSFPCQNAGTCTVVGNDTVCGFNCTCPAGFTGILCQTNTNECASQPCRNGGTCQDLVDGFTCQCPAGFLGTTCETDVDQCASIPCQNGGTCQDQVDAYLCMCPNGFIGTNCETNVDNCASAPCQNGATCLNGIGIFTCLCPLGFGGILCQDLVYDSCTQPTLIATNTTLLDFYRIHPETGIASAYFSDLSDELPTSIGEFKMCTNQLWVTWAVPTTLNARILSLTGELVANVFIDGGGAIACPANPVLGSVIVACDGVMVFGIYSDGVDACLIQIDPFSYNTIFIAIVTGITLPGTMVFNSMDGYLYLVVSSTGETIQIDPMTGSVVSLGSMANPCSVEPVLAWTGLSYSVDAAQFWIFATCSGDGFNDTRTVWNLDPPSVTLGSIVNSVTVVPTQDSLRQRFVGLSVSINETLGRCLNGGLCVGNFSVNGTDFICQCQPGFTGVLCQTDIDECASQPCQNGGTCVDGINSFTCFCSGCQGTGLLCEVPQNASCLSSPCQNGGSCNDININSTSCAFNCTCPAGYTGFLCETDVDECASQPCQNSGTCLDGVNNFTCICPCQWAGIVCQVDTLCGSFPCQNGGTCDPAGNETVCNFVCTCPPGFSGVTCQTEMDECASVPCQNGGTCTDLVNGFTCNCLAGFSGVLCETEIDECSSAPCQNGASCVDLVHAFTCICLPGYSGTLCETEVNECASLPCLNTGTCADLVNGYNCTCPAGFVGVNCETDVDECASQPCHNCGTCVDGVNGFTCTCLVGVTGTVCETVVDDCASQPCENGGTCMVTDFNCTIPLYTCLCPPGFSGLQCQTEIDECASQPCRNGGTCLDVLNGYSCICLPGYSGAECETDVDECGSMPCQNGATCVDALNGFNCTCRLGTFGTLCETDVSECASFPCQNNGTCVDIINGFSCLCQPGFSGLVCQSEMDECASNPCQNGGTCIDLLDGYICECPFQLAPNATDLGAARNFAVLGSSTVTSTGFTIVTGDLGLSPGTSVTGFPPGIVVGVQHITDAVAAQAQLDAVIAYNDLAGRSSTTVPAELGGTTQLPGAYDSGTLQITGTLILDGQGDPDAVFVFKSGSTLITAGSSVVLLVNGTKSCNVFWQVGSSATLGTSSIFQGTILASASITATTSATMNGRLIALGAAVTLDTNPVARPVCASSAFAGLNCETGMDECASIPCQNGGTCSDQLSGFECTCPPGFSGILCQTEINECVSQPCALCQECVDLVNGYNCICLNVTTPTCFNETIIVNTTCPQVNVTTSTCFNETIIVNTTCPQVNVTCPTCFNETIVVNMTIIEFVNVTCANITCFNETIVINATCPDVNVTCQPSFNTTIFVNQTCPEFNMTCPPSFNTTILVNTTCPQVNVTCPTCFNETILVNTTVIEFVNVTCPNITCPTCFNQTITVNTTCPLVNTTQCTNTTIFVNQTIVESCTNTTIFVNQTVFVPLNETCTNTTIFVTNTTLCPAPLNITCPANQTIVINNTIVVNNTVFVNQTCPLFNVTCPQSVNTTVIVLVNTTCPLVNNTIVFVNTTCPVCNCTAPPTPPCPDVNECATLNGACDPLTTCFNTPCNRTCGGCPPGYKGNGATGCRDINECQANNGGCDSDLFCINTPGSRTCSPCPPGMVEEDNDGNRCGCNSCGCHTQCGDVDECATNHGGCDSHVRCTNTKGGYTCGNCPSGYVGSGYQTCTLLSALVTLGNCSNLGCFNNGTCNVTTSQCQCLPGFAGSLCQSVTTLPVIQTQSSNQVRDMGIGAAMGAGGLAVVAVIGGLIVKRKSTTVSSDSSNKDDETSDDHKDDGDHKGDHDSDDDPENGRGIRPAGIRLDALVPPRPSSVELPRLHSLSASARTPGPAATRSSSPGGVVSGRTTPTTPGPAARPALRDASPAHAPSVVSPSRVVSSPPRPVSPARPSSPARHASPAYPSSPARPTVVTTASVVPMTSAVPRVVRRSPSPSPANLPRTASLPDVRSSPLPSLAPLSPILSVPSVPAIRRPHANPNHRSASPGPGPVTSVIRGPIAATASHVTSSSPPSSGVVVRSPGPSRSPSPAPSRKAVLSGPRSPSPGPISAIAMTDVSKSKKGGVQQLITSFDQRVGPAPGPAGARGRSRTAAAKPNGGKPNVSKPNVGKPNGGKPSSKK